MPRLWTSGLIVEPRHGAGLQKSFVERRNSRLLPPYYSFKNTSALCPANVGSCQKFMGKTTRDDETRSDTHTHTHTHTPSSANRCICTIHLLTDFSNCSRSGALPTAAWTHQDPACRSTPARCDEKLVPITLQARSRHLVIKHKPKMSAA